MKANGFTCGAVGCIGGWCNVMMQLKGLKPRRITFGSLDVADFLSLDTEERMELFFKFPEIPILNHESVSWKTWILARLDRVIETATITNYTHQEMFR